MNLATDALDADAVAASGSSEIAAAVAALDEIKAIRSFARGKFVIDTVARTVVFYAADDTTPLHTWTLSADYKTRTVS